MLVAAFLAIAAIGVVLAEESAGQNTKAAASSDGSADVQIAERLAAAQVELKRLDGPEGLAAGAPEGATPEELEERRALLQALITWYQWQLERADMLADLKQHGIDVGIMVEGGLRLPKSAPYSYLLLDNLRQNKHLLQVAIKAAEAGREIATQEVERAHGELRTWEGKGRQLTERQEAIKEPELLARLKWERDLARLQEQVAGARLGTVDLVRQSAEEEIKLLNEQLTPVTQAIARMAPEARFSKEEFEVVRHNLATSRRVNQAEMGPALAASAQALSALDRARKAAQRARSRPGTTSPSADLAHLDRLVQIQKARADNAAYRVNTISLSGQMLNVREDFWRRRWLMANGADHAAIKKAVAAIDQISSTMAALRARAELQLELANEQRSALQSGVMGARQTAEANDFRELASMYDERAESVREALQAIEAADNLVNRWTQEVEERGHEQPGARRLAHWAFLVRDGAQRVWNFEMVAVEDTIKVEGRTFTGKRSITVNKVVTAILIFVLGSWFSGWALKRIQGVAISRFGKDKHHVQLVRKWVHSLLVLILAAIALVWVKIPFTVFAFLGGAVAIGAGFGMQTLLKNLISGLMLLVERPFRLGDLVEVAGMRGRIMDIGVRSSVVRGVEGIETLIPNSVFIEQNVTNWTYSSHKVRFSIALRVAYGSDVRKVREMLLNAAARHSLILTDPPPSVLFNDFGNDALVFNLNFWLEIRPEVDSDMVRSDLRFTIERALGDAGMVIAFPQRDVHLDTARPLQVEVVSSAPASSNRHQEST